MPRQCIIMGKSKEENTEAFIKNFSEISYKQWKDYKNVRCYDFLLMFKMKWPILRFIYFRGTCLVGKRHYLKTFHHSRIYRLIFQFSIEGDDFSCIWWWKCYILCNHGSYSLIELTTCDFYIVHKLNKNYFNKKSKILVKIKKKSSTVITCLK